MGPAGRHLGPILVVLVIILATLTWIGNRYTIAPENEPPRYEAPEYPRTRGS